MNEKTTSTLAGKRALITGASSGIGAACATAFAAEGADLILVGRREERLNHLAEAIQADHNIACRTFVCDIRDNVAVDTLFKTLDEEGSSVEILINNAGLALGLDKIQQGEPNQWDQMIDTNIKGLLYVTRHCLPGMLKRQQGYIFNLASISSHYVYSGGAVYCATKFAVNALSEGMRLDLLGTNIRVTQISPGAVETEFSLVRFQGDQAQADAVYDKMQPLEAEDIAGLIVHCATLPQHVNVNEITVSSIAQVGTTIHRQTD